MSIVPYGYYSLIEVFDKIGLAIFGDGWDASIPHFMEETKNASSIFPMPGKQFNLPPIHAWLLISDIDSFLNKKLTKDKLKRFSHALYDVYTPVEEKPLNSLLASALQTPQSTRSEIPTSPLSQALLNQNKINKATKVGLIQKGIKYAHIAKGIQQCFNSGILKAEILDRESGKQEFLPEEFWLANKSVFSFGTGRGSYAHVNAYNLPSDGKPSPFINTFEYKGLIIAKTEQVNKFLADTFPPEKKAKPSKGGRNPKVNWEEVQIEMFRLLKDRDMKNPPSQTVIAQQVQKFCQNKYDAKSVPAIKTIKEKLKPIYDMLKNSLINPQEKHQEHCISSDMSV